jgi:hypothetical protein
MPPRHFSSLPNDRSRNRDLKVHKSGSVEVLSMATAAGGANGEILNRNFRKS